jgi:hypothetical protein
MYIVNSTGFIRELSDNAQTQGIYEEQITDDELTPDDIEKNIDAIEEADALDIDMDAEDFEERAASNYDKQEEIDFNN